ncbi:hypothetical protein DM02DRAFT_671999 [Periconia macrospinosa]|uniref:Uncharacterized protein n=1 Tax=Periconia macrospinosa TaxID=97972 RepID=A0A2V1DR33_9PLEO|nr:hypothetical protein DM02DRAFT_671999 [Periconia macrospinosa]
MSKSKARERFHDNKRIVDNLYKTAGPQLFRLWLQQLDTTTPPNYPNHAAKYNPIRAGPSSRQQIAGYEIAQTYSQFYSQTYALQARSDTKTQTQSSTTMPATPKAKSRAPESENETPLFVWRCNNQACKCKNETVGDLGGKVVWTEGSFWDRAPTWVGAKCGHCGLEADKSCSLVQIKLLDVGE